MDTLPREILSQIISFIPDDTSRRNLRLASTQWFKEMKYSNFIFNFTTAGLLPTIVRRLKQYTTPISLTFDRPKCKLNRRHYELLAELTHLTKLNLHELMVEQFPGGWMQLTSLTNLEEAALLPAEVTSYLTNLKKISSRLGAAALNLAPFSKLESLEFNSPYSFDALRIIPHTQHLTHLAVYSYPRKDLPAEQALFEHDEISTRFPRLKSFRIEEENAMNNKAIQVPFLPSLESLFIYAVQLGSLPGNAHSKLTSLTLHCQVVDLPSLATLTSLRALSLFKQSGSMPFLTALSNLESLQIHSTNSIKVAPYISSDKLTSLRLSGELRFDNIGRFSTLRKLNVGGLISEPVFGCFRYLTKLEIIRGTAHVFPFIESLTALKALKFIARSNVPVGNSILHLERLRALEKLFINSNGGTIDLKELPPGLKSICISWLAEGFAESVSKLTTLERIGVHNASLLTDHSISLWTGLTNLTSLTLYNVQKLTGVTLTLLTSLQQLEMRCGYKLKVKRSLKKKMPHLYDVDIVTEST